jgi:DNA-binding MarR family transcriptional regulator
MRSRLQEELKQNKPFIRVGDEALVSVLRTAAVLDHAISDALKPYGVTMTQYNVLRILRGAEPNGLCGREIGERLIARVPDVPRLLDRMDELGLITRERDMADRRHVTARISLRGLRVIDESAAALDAVETRLVAGIGEEELRVVVDTLASIRGNL